MKTLKTLKTFVLAVTLTVVAVFSSQASPVVDAAPTLAIATASPLVLMAIALVAGVALAGMFAIARNVPKMALGLFLAMALLLGAFNSYAGTDATVITTAADGAFSGIATLCVTIGTFFVVYRLVKRVK